MKRLYNVFDFYKEEYSSDKTFYYHPYTTIKTREIVDLPECPDSDNTDRLKIVKAIKDFKIDFIKQNNLLKEIKYLKEVCMMFLKSTEFKSSCLKKHIVVVSAYSAALAESINLSTDEINKTEIGGLLHDIGKMSFPDYIFYKTGKLNETDLNEIEKHPLNGYFIIKGTLSEEYDDIAQIALYHHEKWDGTGYPNKLKGEEIPVGARIVSICDSFDSMIRKKYSGQKLKSVEETLTDLEENKFGQWDPELVRVFINIITKNEYALYNSIKTLV